MYRIQMCVCVPLCTLSRTFVPTYAPALQRGVSCRVGIILALLIMLFITVSQYNGLL